LKNHRWLVTAIFAALLIAAGLVLWGWHSTPPSFTNASPPPDPTEPPPAWPAAPPASANAPTPITKRNQNEEIEVCGIGKVTVDGENPIGAVELINRTTAAARGRWLSAMLNSDDTRTRATGLFLEDKVRDGEFLSPPSPKTVDSLVQIALDSKDPGVYALAVYQCTLRNGQAPSRSCEQIDLNTWANMDRDNASPWLTLATKARAVGDTTAENEAYAQAAKAKQFHNYAWALLSNAEPLYPADATPLERYELSTRIIGAAAAIPLDQTLYGSRHCSIETISDANVRRQCDAMAELLVNQANTVIDLAIGISIGTRVGWPETRLSALRDRRDALLQANRGSNLGGPEKAWSCDTISWGNAFVSDWARTSEIAADQARIERSGKTIPELAQEYRAFIAKIRRP
jgi:hypothetical protein